MKEMTKEWLKFGQSDLEDAEVLFKNKSYKNSVLHCHQAVEKILKSIIVQKGFLLIRTHDLISLVYKAKLELPKDVVSFIEELNPHYLPAKYPDITFKFNYNRTKVQKIIKNTEEVFKWLKLELARGQ